MYIVKFKTFLFCCVPPAIVHRPYPIVDKYPCVLDNLVIFVPLVPEDNISDFEFGGLVTKNVFSQINYLFFSSLFHPQKLENGLFCQISLLKIGGEFHNLPVTVFLLITLAMHCSFFCTRKLLKNLDLRISAVGSLFGHCGQLCSEACNFTTELFSLPVKSFSFIFDFISSVVENIEREKFSLLFIRSFEACKFTLEFFCFPEKVF